nr:hypothetical protein [Ktedonobacterales bacterium]
PMHPASSSFSHALGPFWPWRRTTLTFASAGGTGGGTSGGGAAPPPGSIPPGDGTPDEQRRNRPSGLIALIIAIIILLLLACVALAPGLLKTIGNARTQPTPTSPPRVVTSPSPLPSPSPSPSLTPTPQLGLLGQYYRMPTYGPGQPVPTMPSGTPVFTAVDSNLNVAYGIWGENGTMRYPHADKGTLGPNGFAIRWTGSITVPATDTYTFYATSDDGVRVWVNGQLLIDNWTVHAQSFNCNIVAGPGTPTPPTPSPRCVSIALTAGQPASIKVEYYENQQDGATIQLFWQSSTIARQIVPASAFSH